MIHTCQPPDYRKLQKNHKHPFVMIRKEAFKSLEKCLSSSKNYKKANYLHNKMLFFTH